MVLEAWPSPNLPVASTQPAPGIGIGIGISIGTLFSQLSHSAVASSSAVAFHFRVNDKIT